MPSGNQNFQNSPIKRARRANRQGKPKMTKFRSWTKIFERTVPPPPNKSTVKQTTTNNNTESQQKPADDFGDFGSSNSSDKSWVQF